MVVAAAAAAVVGCGSEADYANDPRPPVPENITAAITQEQVTVSPKELGAGPVTLIVANQTDEPQTVTVETTDVTSGPGISQSTSPINPQGTATLKIDLAEGDYTVSVDGKGIAEATLAIGEPRPSSQDELLQP